MPRKIRTNSVEKQHAAGLPKLDEPHLASADFEGRRLHHGAPAGFEPATLCLEGKCSSPTELRARNSILADVKSPSSSQPAECWMLTPERSRRSTALTACTAHRENRAMFCSYQRPRARVPGESQCKR